VNIPILLAVAGGGYLLYRWYSSATSDFGETDPNGNPPGTDYTDDGLPDPPPSGPTDPAHFDRETGELTVIQDNLGGWVSPAEMRRDARTLPAGAGGLRTDRRTDRLDTSLDGIAYGQLARNLEAKDSRIYVYDNPYLFLDSTDPGRFTPLKADYAAGRWHHTFTVGKLYRLLVCEEPIVALCEQRPGGVNPAVLRIMDRPRLSNWQTSAPSVRQWDSDEQKQRWWYYDNLNPTYYKNRPWPPAIGHPEMQVLCQAATDPTVCPKVGEWVQETSRNCHHPSHFQDQGFPHIIYDPRLDGCRGMTQEEADAYDAAVASYEERQRQAEEERIRLSEDACNLQWGVSCSEHRRWASPTTGIPQAEQEARVLALRSRIPVWSYPTDLTEIAPEAAPRIANLETRAGWQMSDEMRDARANRGHRIYRDRLSIIQRREVMRDYASIVHMTPGGAFNHIAVGGPWGFVSIWVPPPHEQQFRVATPPRVVGPQIRRVQL
jgi:hypothetical protein